jgi:hypothetical protein
MIYFLFQLGPLFCLLFPIQLFCLHLQIGHIGLHIQSTPHTITAVWTIVIDLSQELSNNMSLLLHNTVYLANASLCKQHYVSNIIIGTGCIVGNLVMHD